MTGTSVDDTQGTRTMGNSERLASTLSVVTEHGV
jgi:hypothetical protein